MPLPRFHRLDSAKQSQILDAAAQEFGAHGYDAASMNQIIEAAGLSKGAMYYYFDGKADLWTTLADAVFEEVGALEDAFAEVETPATFWEVFRGLYDEMMALHTQSPRLANMMRALTRTTGTDAAMQLVVSSHGMGRMRASMAGLLEHGQRVGAVRTDLAQEQLLDLMMATNTVTDRWLATAAYGDDPGQAQALLEKVVDLNIRLLQ